MSPTRQSQDKPESTATPSETKLLAQLMATPVIATDTGQLNLASCCLVLTMIAADLLG